MPDTRPLTADTYCDLRYTDPEHEDGYLSLRRLKFIATGPLADDCALGLQVLAKQGNRSRSDGLYLQDLWARWDLGSGRLTVGQFKPPFGLERLTSDTELATIDRSVAITRLIPNGSLGRSFARDWGVQWDAGSHTVRYAVAMFVGSGANTSPHGVGPLVTGRLTWTLGRGWVPQPRGAGHTSLTSVRS